jgi:hypothetical protein
MFSLTRAEVEGVTRDVVPAHVITRIQEEIIKTTIDVVGALFKRTSDNSMREGGIYPSDTYFKLLTQHNQTKRKALLAESGKFLEGHAPSEYFEMIEDAGYLTGFKSQVFRLREGKCPIEALEAMEKGLSLIDCGALCSLIYHKVLRQVFKDSQGDESRFKEIFSAKGHNRLEITMGVGGYGSLKPFIVALQGAPQKGDVVHVDNLRKYKVKHFTGRMSGHTMVADFLNGNLLIRGMDIPPEGINESQLEELMIGKYNLKAKDLRTTGFISDKHRSIILERYPNAETGQNLLANDNKVTVGDYRSEGGAKISDGASMNHSIILWAKLLPIDELPNFFQGMSYVSTKT